jgi:hypothetical protein
MPIERDKEVDQLLTTSNREITGLEVMHRLQKKRFSQKESAGMLGIGIRQVKHLFRAYMAQDAQSLVSDRLYEELVRQVIDLLYERYWDFGPTLAHDKLIEVHGLHLSKEIMRQMMIAERLWKPKRSKKPLVHHMREWRACFREFVQIDGSGRDWLEGRGASLILSARTLT